MEYKISVYGSAADTSSDAVDKAKQIGEELAKKDVVVITGACPGLPYAAAISAKDKGGKVWGFCPAPNLKKQQENLPDVDTSIFSKLTYVPSDFDFIETKMICCKYRNVTSVANCDAGIIISGRWGSLNEFTNLADLGKVIGVLTGTGGIADELPELVKKVNKDTGAKIFFSDSPIELINLIYKELEERFNN